MFYIYNDNAIQTYAGTNKTIFDIVLLVEKLKLIHTDNFFRYGRTDDPQSLAMEIRSILTSRSISSETKRSLRNIKNAALRSNSMIITNGTSRR